MNIKSILGTVCACYAIVSFNANASAINIWNFSGNETVIDFESLGGVAPEPGPFSIGPVTFSESSTGSGTSSPGWRVLNTNLLGTDSDILTDNSGQSNIVLDFSTPVTRAGLVVGIGNESEITDYQIDFFDTEYNVIGSLSYSIFWRSNGGFFAGWENASGISRIQIIEASNNGRVGGIDDIRFENVAITPPVPIPAAVWLFGSGLIALAGFARRKNA